MERERGNAVQAAAKAVANARASRVSLVTPGGSNISPRKVQLIAAALEAGEFARQAPQAHS